MDHYYFLTALDSKGADVRDICLSNNDKYLFLAGQDGNIFSFKIHFKQPEGGDDVSILEIISRKAVFPPHKVITMSMMVMMMMVMMMMMMMMMMMVVVVVVVVVVVMVMVMMMMMMMLMMVNRKNLDFRSESLNIINKIVYNYN